LNRRNSSTNNRILLDTSFLLPILGFETSNEIMKAFHKLSLYELYYSDISLLEALWKIAKTIKGSKEEIARIKEGIKALRSTAKQVNIEEEAVENTINMYKLGHKDIIDNLLYSIAKTGKLKLLTVDKSLIEFIEKHEPSKENIIHPKELK